jgi:hypothetical protein
MDGYHHRLILLDDRFAVCRLDRRAAIPPWAAVVGFCSITRTPEELSVVCPESAVPEGTRAERGWRALRVAGILDFALVGVLASLAVPLARAGIGLFVISTYDTDYLLVRETDLDRAVEALVAAGHSVEGGRRVPAS